MRQCPHPIVSRENQVMWRKIQALQYTIDQEPLRLLTTNQGNGALLVESAGKQCVALLHDSDQIEDFNLQSNSTLNTFIGKNQHTILQEHCVQ